MVRKMKTAIFVEPGHVMNFATRWAIAWVALTAVLALHILEEGTSLSGGAVRRLRRCASSCRGCRPSNPRCGSSMLAARSSFSSR